jgi:aspartyl-tRNA(Asn)/glutamyl-tRNA(Gln) amidotransferase subunit C
MSLTSEEVDHIALLARLELTPQEKEQYREQLSSILLPPRSRLRRDEVKPGLTQEEALRNAPDQTQGQFRVPPILDR